MSTEGKRRRGAGLAFVLVFMILAALVAAMDGRQTWHVLRHADWGVLPAALFFTLVSYFCLSAGFAAINRIFGIRLPAVDLLEIGFVSFALNNLISVGGSPATRSAWCSCGGAGSRQATSWGPRSCTRTSTTSS